MFAVLDRMHDVEELTAWPLWKVHRLAGDRRGTCSLHVTRNRRLTFRIEDDGLLEVNLEDYLSVTSTRCSRSQIPRWIILAREVAARWRVFQRTLQGIRGRSADDSPDEFQQIVDEAIRQVRAARPAKKKG